MYMTQLWYFDPDGTCSTGPDATSIYQTEKTLRKHGLKYYTGDGSPVQHGCWDFINNQRVPVPRIYGWSELLIFEFNPKTLQWEKYYFKDRF